MWQNFFRALGRGLRAGALAVIRLLWEVVTELVRALARGTSDVIRRMMPWAVGAGAIWGLLAFAPELFNLVIALAITVFGLKIMIKGLLPAPKKKKK